MGNEKRGAKTKDEDEKSKHKKHHSSKGAIQSSGGEAQKGADERRTDPADLADQQDNKRGNIGPSGQGSHRGRERHNIQSGASGRPDVGSAGSRNEGNERR